MRQILTLFRKLVTLILGLNCVKDITVTKIAKQLNLKRPGVS